MRGIEVSIGRVRILCVLLRIIEVWDLRTLQLRILLSSLRKREGAFIIQMISGLIGLEGSTVRERIFWK